MNNFYVAAVVLLLGVVAILWARVKFLERDLAREVKRREEFWDAWHEEKWSVRQALAAAGLELVPGTAPTWQKKL